MTCEKCVQAVKNSLSNIDGIQNIDISLETGTVIVDSSLPYSVIQQKIENSGRRAVLKGYGGKKSFFSSTFTVQIHLALKSYFVAKKICIFYSIRPYLNFQYTRHSDIHFIIMF